MQRGSLVHAGSDVRDRRYIVCGMELMELETWQQAEEELSMEMKKSGMEMEELVSIVGDLAGKYTGYESTSITYEKAKQLMEAVLYCIREAEQAGGETAVCSDRVSAKQLYEMGASLVEEKTKKALAMYHEILPEFDSYGNRFLYDTFVVGLPEFFRRYDCKFEPQDTILTLDYPVMKDISGCAGIDRIYEYILCIRAEQKFLKRFPREGVIGTLKKYNREYEETPDNICGILLRASEGEGFTPEEVIEI